MIPASHYISARPPDLPDQENELSRRYLRMLESWLPVGIELFEPWPLRPRSGHFLGGAHWYGLETVGPAFALAVAASAPTFDTTATGVSRDQLQEMSLAAIRYLCFTHDTGPSECVRPPQGLGDPRNFNAKWGERGAGFFKESQCGRTTALLAAACLLLGNRVDTETLGMVAKVQADYLARFGEMAPRSGVYLDTQMEENGWTAWGLTGAHLFLQGHPQADAWEAHSRGWMFSTCAAPQDAQNGGPLDSSTVVRHTGKTITCLPDYWAENHRMVHPSYTAAGVKFTLYIGNLLRLWQRDLPDQLLWNRQAVYDNLKIATDDGGYAHSPQGMDWPYLPAVGNETVHAVASVLFDDGEAAALQRRGLRLAELRQTGNDGRLVDPQVAAQARERDRATVLREASISEVAHLYLFHRLFGPGAQPVNESQLTTRLAGVRHFPHAGFIHHRHRRGQTSLSWRNSIMALPLTQEGIYTIAPARDCWLARPEVSGCPDSQKLHSLHVDEREDLFAAAIALDRCQGTLRQEILLASLPDGRVLSWERLWAQRPCTLTSLEQGFLRITNEKFPLLNNGCRGQRVLYSSAGATTYRGWIGQSPKDDIIDKLDAPAWLNIDDRLGLRLLGSGPAQYRNCHFYPAYQVIADDLVTSVAAPRTLDRGETAGTLAALLCPGQHHAETAATAFALIETDDGAILLLTGDYLLGVVFGPGTAATQFSLSAAEPLAIFAGVTVNVNGMTASYRLALTPARPCLRQQVATAQVEGNCSLEAAPSGIYARGQDNGCTVSIGTTTHRLQAGDVAFFAVA
ncbi:MAG: hypothetical protein GKR89_34560 [Candidatus Latescibacteria bacterium]|nr:hypothetical protein [Candidatus Latescibacterota bacterium]